MLHRGYGLHYRAAAASGGAKHQSGLKPIVFGCLVALHWMTADAAEFTGLGDLSGGIFYSSAHAVSANGLVVAGDASDGGDNTPFRWTASGGMVSLGVAGEATGISADGNTIAGTFANAGHNEAYRWTAGAGVVALGTAGFINSFARGLSPDGRTVVGFVNGAGMSQAFRWTTGGGMELLGWFAGGMPQSMALGVSDNGIVVGYGGHIGSSEAFYWTSALGAITGLGYLPGGSNSIALAISPNGQYITGQSDATDGLGHPVLWTKSGATYAITNLGMRVGWVEATGESVSADGSVVVGIAETAGDSLAFRWSSTVGMQTVQEWLESSGVNLGTWKLEGANGVSADGKTIVGYGTNPDGNTEAFLARGDALIGMTDFSNSVASLREISHFPVEVARASIMNGVPGLYGLTGFSAAPIYQHVSGSRGDLGGAALTWRENGIAVSGQLGRVYARTSGLHDGGRGDYRGWWAGGAASLGLGTLLGQPAIAGLELDAALRIGRYDTDIDRNYLNGVTTETAHGDTDSRDFTALARLGWHHNLTDSVQLLPYVQLLHSCVHVDSYTESGGTMSGVVSSQERSNLETSAGIRAAWQVHPDLRLHGRYSLNHLRNEAGAPISVTVLGLGTFSADGDRYDGDWHEFGAGVDWKIMDKVRLNTSATRTAGSDYPEHWSLGVALNFGL